MRVTEAKSISRIPETPGFDPKNFLEKAGVGRTLIDLKKSQVLFSQGDAADAVFYPEKGNVKLTVVSERGKEATVALLEAWHPIGLFLAHGVCAKRGRACFYHCRVPNIGITTILLHTTSVATRAVRTAS